MKTFICTCLLCITSSFCVFAQNQQTDENTARLNFSIHNHNGLPIQVEVFFFSSPELELSAVSDNQGNGYVLLPVGNMYTVYIRESEQFLSFHVPHVPHLHFSMPFVFDDSQKHELHPTPTKAVVNLTIVDEYKHAIQERVRVEGKTTTYSYTGFSNNAGRIQLLLENGHTYTVSFDEAPNYSEFTLPQEPFTIFDRAIAYLGSQAGNIHPTDSLAVLHIYYLSVEKQALEGEIIRAVSLEGQEYTAYTDNTGKAQIPVPINQSYRIHTKHFFDITQIDVPQTPKTIVEFTYSNISSKQHEQFEKEYQESLRRFEEEWAKRQKEIDSIQQAQERAWQQYVQEEVERNRIAQAKRDSIQRFDEEQRKAFIAEQRKQDSLQKAVALRERHVQDSIRRANLDEKKRRERFVSDSLAEIRKQQQIERIQWNARHETENAIWGDTNTVVFKVMRRNNWEQKIIVVDVTGSMTPYANLIKNWYILHFAEYATSDFVFFNDGDDTPDQQKIIGKTGGIYVCRVCNILHVEQTYKKAARFHGGDAPENDIEALLTAMSFAPRSASIILIADNNSRIRDFELLSQLSMPVHVILCGVQNSVINFQYIELAYATEGSVHTIEEDISLKRRLRNEEIITIAERQYRYYNGKFYRIR